MSDKYTRKAFMYNCSYRRIDIMRSSVNLKKVSLFIIMIASSLDYRYEKYIYIFVGWINIDIYLIDNTSQESINVRVFRNISYRSLHGLRPFRKPFPRKQSHHQAVLLTLPLFIFLHSLPPPLISRDFHPFPLLSLCLFLFFPLSFSFKIPFPYL